ncbi:MAG: hypothetical protein ACI976_002904 [Aureispira sp.]|jgi:hypothetical protein
MKYWINKTQKEDKVIVITNDVFYTYSPNEKDLIAFQNELRLNKIPTQLSGMQFARIRHIDFEDGKNRIEIHYDKKDILEVLVPNLSIKSEIKEALVSIVPSDFLREQTQKTFLEKASKYGIAILITSFVTFLTYNIAVDLENGDEYAGDGLGSILIGISETTGPYGALFLGLLINCIIILIAFPKIQHSPTIDRFWY